MRATLIFLFLAFAVVLHAQSRGKVAIVNCDQLTVGIVEANATETVEIDTALPQNLNGYVALFFGSYSFLLDSVTQVKLVNFIDSGGMLYTTASFAADTIDSSNPFWLRVGLTRFLATGLSFNITGVYGVGFASNIRDSLPPDYYQSGYGGPEGSISPVLDVSGNPVGGVYFQGLAFISDDTTLRVVVDEGAGDGNYPGNYYSEFISDVVCNYFNLCAADVKTTPQAFSLKNLSIIRDSRDNGYSASYDFTTEGQVSVFNSLGVIVWSKEVQAGENLEELPATLRNGFYFVSVQSGDNVSVGKFSVVN